MKQWLQSIGILERPVIDSQPTQFLYKAKRHYCEACDRFFEKVQGAAAHIRIKHGK